MIQSSINTWLEFLRSSHGAAALPFILLGMGLMFFGWRMWKVCVVLSFGLFGAALTAMFTSNLVDQWLYVLGGGLILGALSYWPAKFAIGVLGGLIGAAMIMYLVSSFGLSDMVLYSIGAAGFLISTAYAFLNRQHLVIIVTAFIGAILVVSGLASIVMAMPSLWGPVRNLASSSVVVVPFILLVPTVMSCFYQIAEMRRIHAAI